MIKINNDRCGGCGHCSFIRFSLPLVRSEPGADFYENPGEEDRRYVENIIMECPAAAITIEP